MDGTLIDSEPLWLEAETDVMRDLGAPWSTQDQVTCLGGPLERVAQYMVERSGTTIPVSVVGQFLLDRVCELMREAPLLWRPGATTLLREAIDKGIPTALVTASWAVLVDQLANRIKAEIGSNPFHVTVAGDSVSQTKPHPEPYETAARLLHLSTGACLALEDSTTGVASALAAGCQVVAIPHLADIGSHVASSTSLVVVQTLEGESLEQLWGRFGV
jgi:HAD superfamily hydrolase (TIGR01509 family)